MKYEQFAAAGRASAPTLIIHGKVINRITFVSREFTGTMDGQNFWDDLAAYAEKEGKFVYLMYPV